MSEEQDINKAKKAEKVVITYQDGHTESFNTFIALVALGLTPVGKDGNDIIYMAEEGKLQTRAIAHVTAPIEVMAALVNSLTEIVETVISHSNPEEALDFMEAILSVGTGRVEEHTEIKTKEMRPREN